MKNSKLKIEIHKKTSDTITYFSDKIKYIKNSKRLHKLLKEKLKDRHRIKGPSFSGSQMKENKIIHLKKKESSSDLLDVDEANYLRSIIDYEKLKHEIFIKDQKDKEKKIKENNLNELLKKDINYTNLKETIYQFIRLKNKSNLYRANILKRKMELKLANKINKKNLINKTLKNLKLHFKTIKGKIDLGKQPIEETENEYTYKKIVEQIVRSRSKYINKARNENMQSFHRAKSGFSKNVALLETEKNYEDKDIFNIMLNNLYTNLKKDQNESKFLIKNKNNKNENDKKKGKNENKKFESFYNTEFNENDNLNKNLDYFREHILKRRIKKKKKQKNFSDKSLKTNINDFETEYRTQRLSSFKYNSQTKSKIYYNLPTHSENSHFNKKRINLINNKTYSNKIISTDNNRNGNNNSKNKINSRNTSLLNKSNLSSINNKHFIKDLNILEKMKRNNLMRKKNPFFWNNSIKTVQTAGFRKITNKVTNKPLYITKIVDLVKEYHRIKSVSKNSRIRMREQHLTNIKNIDKIVNVKEDLLMFNLKLKFFNCSFPQKRKRTISKKKIMKKKIKNCLEIIDNSFNLRDDYESSIDN